MDKKIKLVALMGKAGAGKDALLHKIFENFGYDDFEEIISCTTRPPREGEVNGVNYHFLTSEEFADRLMNGDMIEATVFRDWCYGTSYDSLNPDKINIGVYNPQGVGIFLDMGHLIDLYVLYVDCDDKTRLIRQLTREKDPDVNEIIRRFQTDYEDFGKERSVWEVLDMPGHIERGTVNNGEDADLDVLAFAVVDAIRYWAEQDN